MPVTTEVQDLEQKDYVFDKYFKHAPHWNGKEITYQGMKWIVVDITIDGEDEDGYCYEYVLYNREEDITTTATDAELEDDNRI